ncbi:MAG: hypothetical protein LBH60_00520 [Prevotellaceae bacterium]|nr:hypothetical protein [Prevotellaceae bacterium]
MEVDFFIPEERKAIQVSYSIADMSTRQREVKALLKLSEIYSLDKLEIVTWDEETTLSEGRFTVRAIPVWKWLLDI